MKHVLLIAILLTGWAVQARTRPPGKTVRLKNTAVLSVHNQPIRDSMDLNSLKQHSTGGNSHARQATKTTAVTQLTSLSTTCFSGNYADLTNKPVLFSGNYVDLANKPVLFSGNYADLTNKPVLFSGSYADLCCKPTTLSAFTNDADYQTGDQVRAAIRSATDTLNTRLAATASALSSVSATAAQALALAQSNQGNPGSTGGQAYILQYRASNVNTTAGASQSLTHNFGANTGIDRIVAYEVNTRVSVDMPFDTSSVTDTQVIIQPLVTTNYTAIIVIGHKLQ